MTIINFPSPPLTVGETYTENGITYTWDGEKWIAFAIGRDSMVPPDVTGVVLTKTTAGNRFTSQTYKVNPTIVEDGDPASAKFARVKFTNPDGIIEARPQTDEITNVVTTQFADGFDANQINDNVWRDIYWCGQPYNCYIAQGNGSSVDNFATSTDGQNWTRRQATIGGSTWGLEGNFAYSPQDGRLYVVGSEVNSGSGSRKAVMWRTTDAALADAGFEFERTTDPGMPSEGDHGHNGFGDLYWDEGTARWWAARTSSSNGRTASFLRGPTGPSPVGTWTGLVSPLGSEVGRLMIHQDGSGTWSANGANQSGSLTGNKTWWLPTPASSSTSQVILGNGQDPIGRWAKVGTVGWICAASTSYSTGIAPFIATHLGDNPPSSPTPTMNNPITLFPGENITFVDLRDALWIDSLGIGVVCGWMTTDTRDKHGCLITTSDCQNFNLIWTNQPGDTEQYRWDRMFWDAVRQELILVAGAGTNPGFRAGYTQTVGEQVAMPQLTFASADGLSAFSVGMAVEEDNGTATGVAAEINLAGPSMIVKATVNGPWDVGNRVTGPPSSFGDAFGVIASDGNISGILPENAFVQMDSNGDFDLQFPATFVDGQAPDTVLPADTTIEVEYRARSEVNGFIADSNATSNQITPT